MGDNQIEFTTKQLAFIKSSGGNFAGTGVPPPPPPIIIRVHEGKNHFYKGNIGIGIPPIDTGVPVGLTVAGNISAYGAILSNEGITSTNYVFSNNYLGTWNGGPISGSKVNVEAIDLRSTDVPGNLFLKSNGLNGVEWDTIDDTEIIFDNNYIDGNLTVIGDIIEYAADGIIYSKTSVFSKDLTSGVNTLNTFDKTQFKTAKYVITIAGGSNRTACEVLVTHNETTADGTTYGIVDAQATSLLTNINVSVGATTIDLIITASSDCTAIVHGVAHY